VTTIHLIRHAKAKSRLEWDEPDELRPLTKRGRRQAAALAELLRHEPFGQLVSSPSLRCMQTLEPLASAVELPIETTETLAEGAAADEVLTLLVPLARQSPIACCTHGDVLFDVARSVASAGVPLDGPFDVPVASAWILAVEDERVSSARFLERPAPAG
jgi:broad specificity phosphatase PhoE